MSDLLDAGAAALAIVAVNPGSEDIGPHLEHAVDKVVARTTTGDSETAYEETLQQAG